MVEEGKKTNDPGRPSRYAEKPFQSNPVQQAQPRIW